MKSCLLGFLAILGITSAALAANSDVVAKVGDKAIDLKEFNEKYEDVLARTMNPPSKETFLEDLIRYYAGLQEAEKLNLKSDPIVSKRVDEAVYAGLVEKAIGKNVEKIQVTDAEMMEWYKRNPEIRTSHILIQFKPGANQEEKAIARSRAKEILDSVKKSKRPFEELVALYSDDTLSKSAGGDVGWQSRVALVPTYYDAALRLKKGAISDLIETQFGFHIVKMIGQRPFAEANRQQIRMAVFEEKRKELFDGYFAALLKKYSVKKNTSLLK